MEIPTELPFADPHTNAELQGTTEYIFHIGNVGEIHSFIRSGLIRRKKSQKGQAIRVFHCSEPDGRRSKYGRNSMRLGQAKDRTIQKHFETSSKYSV